MLRTTFKDISRVKRKMNRKLHIMGILFTMVDYRTNYAASNKFNMGFCCYAGSDVIKWGMNDGAFLSLSRIV